jgi:hypothetical protein
VGLKYVPVGPLDPDPPELPEEDPPEAAIVTLGPVCVIVILEPAFSTGGVLSNATSFDPVGSHTPPGAFQVSRGIVAIGYCVIPAATWHPAHVTVDDETPAIRFPLLSM